jgi:hypothetical protein
MTKKDRQNYNLRCLDKLRDIILTYPDLRFMQILYNMNLSGNETDRFYEEPDVTLKSIEEALKVPE